MFGFSSKTAQHGLRPLIHASCPPPLTQLMQRGWHNDAARRPTAVEVVAELENVQRLYEAQKDEQLQQQQQQ